MKIESCKIKLPEENREEISMQIQEICFANEIGWASCGRGKDIRHSGKPYLFIKKIITWMDGDETYFQAHRNPEISHQDFIAKYGPETGAINDYEVGDVRRYGAVGDSKTQPGNRPVP